MASQMSEQAIIDLLEKDEWYRGVVARWVLRHAGCPLEEVSTLRTCPFCEETFDTRTGYNA